MSKNDLKKDTKYKNIIKVNDYFQTKLNSYLSFLKSCQIVDTWNCH